MMDYQWLVRQAQAAGEPARREAYNLLVQQFEDQAQRWAYRVLGDTHLAEDVAQEAFLSAYQHLDQLREPAAFPGWLKRIVLTQCSRLRRRADPPTSPLDDEGDGAAQTDDPEAHLHESEMLAAVERLPDHEREVVRLYYLVGYSQKEIAEQLDVPLTTVKKRLQYAREHLRETLPQMSLSDLYAVLPGGELPDPDTAFAFTAVHPLLAVYELPLSMAAHPLLVYAGEQDNV